MRVYLATVVPSRRGRTGFRQATAVRVYLAAILCHPCPAGFRKAAALRVYLAAVLAPEAAQEYPEVGKDVCGSRDLTDASLGGGAGKG